MRAQGEAGPQVSACVFIGRAPCRGRKGTRDRGEGRGLEGRRGRGGGPGVRAGWGALLTPPLCARLRVEGTGRGWEGSLVGPDLH